MIKNKKPAVIGACVLIALVLLFIGINFLKGVNLFKASNYYLVSYTNVSGLQVSAPVTVNGFKVGQVREIEYEYDNPGHILVELALDKSLKIPKDTKAVIESDMLGTASVRLEMAPNQNYHDVGDHLIGENAQGLMDNVTQDLLPTVSAILPKVDTLLYNINRVVSSPQLTASIERLDAITSNIESTLSTLNSAVASLPATMNNVRKASDTLTDITANVDSLTVTLDRLPLTDTMADVQASVANLKKLTEDLQNENSTLGLLMNDRQLYDNLNNVTSSLDSLFVDIKKNPKRYINIKLL